MNKKIIGIGMVLMLIPAMIGFTALAQEQEQEADRGLLFGQFKSKRLIAMSFESAQTKNITTTDSEISFYISDGRNSLSRISSDLLYDKIALVYYENDTANATTIQPDKNGVFTVALPKTGTYTIGIILQPSIPIPLIGEFITPTDTDTIIVIKHRAFPTTLVLGCVIVIALGSGGVYVWKATKKRELKEK